VWSLTEKRTKAWSKFAFFFFFQYWGLNSGPSPWTTLPALFVMGIFEIGLSNYCPGWLQTMILLISVSWLTRITGVSHWCPAKFQILISVIHLLLVWWFDFYIFLFCVAIRKCTRLAYKVKWFIWLMVLMEWRVQTVLCWCLVMAACGTTW
jgi:hypothetical protein